MASCNMASAASGFVFTPNVTTTSKTSGSSFLFFAPKNNSSSGSRLQLVVRAAADEVLSVTSITFIHRYQIYINYIDYHIQAMSTRYYH
ncbi:unnamed protein product [Linum tenue]|uniref:Uncharacterized protein n=1 Tax=Linum tenue TaxID=586396 RepID=A0AAV0L0Q8_9ROSI|nr:unnamed protein product [Linum tenue]